jgi:hypothetical protein
MFKRQYLAFYDYLWKLQRLPVKGVLGNYRKGWGANENLPFINKNVQGEAFLC